jgi:hypothetical protein
MQKALTEMNIRLKEVLSQIHGVTGLRIIEAILEGERDKQKLLDLCDARIIKHKKEEVLKSLTGKYTKAGLFALQQAYDAYVFYQNQIKQCDQEIQKIIHKMGKGGKNKNLPGKRKPIRHNRPDVDDLGANLIDIFEGRDATVVGGITDYTWLQLLSEVGYDLRRWVTEKHFTSWLGLAPGQHWSGKYKRNKRKKGHPKAGQIFRVAAQGLITSKTIAIGAFGRRIQSRKGPKVAIKAMARKLAVLYWRVMVKGVDYTEKGIENYEQQLLERKKKAFQRLAGELNVYLPNPQPVK